MTDASETPTVTGLPAGLTARTPGLADHEPVVALLAAHQRSVRGSSSVDPAAVASALTGTASWTRRQVVLDDEAGAVVAWASVHDRAAGRTVVDVTLPPTSPATPPRRRAPLRVGRADAAAGDHACSRELDGDPARRQRL